MAKKRTKKKSTSKPNKSAGNAGLEAVIASIEKKFGKGLMDTLDGGPAIHNFKRQTPSGSVGLDMILGPMKRHKDGRWQTGYAPARIVEIYGPEQAGKSTLWIRRTGSGWVRSSTSCMCPSPTHGAARTLVKSREFSLIIVDSVASLVTKAELEGEITDSHVGRQARLMSQSLKVIHAAIGEGKSETTVVFTNQIREKVGVMFGNPETTPGGRALKFYANVRIDLRRSGMIKDPQNENRVIGQIVRAKVIKNKAAAPYQEVVIPLIFGQGIDKWQELFEHSKACGLIQASGAWYSFGDLKAQGEQNFVQLLRQDAGLAYQLYDQLLTQCLAYRGLNPDGTLVEGFEPATNPTTVEQFVPVDDSHLEVVPAEDVPG